MSIAVATAIWVAPLRAQQTGRIEGTVKTVDGVGLGGVSVVVRELDRRRTTDESGRFTVADVPPGDYTLECTLGHELIASTTVRVAAGATATVEATADRELSFTDSITVFSASRRPERLVEAPAAINALGEAEIARGAGSGQLPKLLEFSVGVELTQNGLYDFNLNVRGFNNALNRRIQTLIDGRNPAIPFGAFQEWLVMGSLTDDLARIELVRGPSAALYGANSFNGVVNITTKAPKDSLGGRIRLTAGELDTRRLDGRWAAELGGGWYTKLLASTSESDEFVRSRNQTVEYPGLRLEAIPLVADQVDNTTFSLRLDKHFADDRWLALEAGVMDGGGVVTLIPFGRGQVPEVERTWARANFNSLHWNLLGAYNSRDAPTQIVLDTAGPSVDESYNFKLELQGNQTFARGRGRFVGGLSYGEEEVGRGSEQGLLTLFSRAIHIERSAAFGQLDYDLGDRLKLVLAARVDESDVHDTELSPKAALVYQVRPNHTLRLTYNEAFQVATYVELFLQTFAGLPITQADLQTLLPPGVQFIPVLALGNTNLDVEQIRGLEVGYTGVLGGKVFFTADYYRTRMEDFLTDLLPGINPSFPIYQAPAGVPPEIAAGLNGEIPGLTNGPAGEPIQVFSYGNTGQVDSQGLECALSYRVDDHWTFDANYSWFDFEIDQLTPGTEVHPNAPEHKLALGLVHRRGPFDAALNFRWVDDFLWTVGVFSGTVPSYQVFDLDATYQVSDRWQVGVTISNLTDDRHFEAFGGSLLERLALATASYSW